MVILILIFLFIDVISKYLVYNFIALGESVKIIPNIFMFTHVRNTGAAWSIMSNNTLMVTIISLIIIGGILLYIYKNKVNNNYEKIGYSLIIGGALGNLFDRLINGYVIDFIDINIFGYNYPIFNLADTFIVIGVVLLIIGMWRYGYGDTGRYKK